MTNQEKWEALSARLDEIAAYGRALGKVNFDMECIAPEEGLAQAGEDMAIIGKQMFAMTHDPEFERLICELHEDSEGLTQIQKKSVEHLYEDHEKQKNIPAELDFEMNQASSKAYVDWLSAKKANDYSLFKDSFAKLIALDQKMIDLRDEKKATYYDTCLDDYEKGGSIEQLDAFFGALKERIVPLVKRIETEGKPIREDFMSRPVSVAQQEKFSKYILEKEGLRESALVLMTTEHPFTTNFGPKDVRVTTHYYEDRFVSNIFSTLHEGGHAMYMMYQPQEIYDAHCGENMTSAMHECISRFYENIVGRSEEFVHFLMPKVYEFAGDTFADVTERELYEAVNVARPDLIRMEADELTYGLHILVRYEIEKAFMNGEITVDEVPALWNQKYKEYLGVDVPDDARGCLQDVHWSGGWSYGYFPSYALGNAYGVQILRTMEKDFDVFESIREGNLEPIGAWLTEHVFSIGSLMTPDEWIRTITGEPFNVNYYLDYLEEKFTKIYDLK